MINKKKGKFLRYKFYRRYVTDIWGSLTRNRKNNTTLKLILKKLVKKVRRRIRKLPDRKQRKRMYQKFHLKKRHFDPNRIFNLSKVSKETRKLRIKRLRYRGLLLAMKKKLRVYYGLRLKRRKLRKLTFLVRVKSYRFFSRVLESRIDSLLLRSNFSDSILESRQLVKTGKVKILIPKNKNRVSWFILKNAGHRVSLYTPIELSLKYKKKRREHLVKMVKSKRFCSYPPNYLFVNYKLMHSFVTAKLSDRVIRYTFPGTISYFAGLSKYI